MKEDLAPARRHPAALASIVIAGVAVSALALVTIAYLLGWVPMHGSMPSAPGSIAAPGQQITGTVQQGGLDLLPGETLVAPAEAPTAAPPAPATTPAPAAVPGPSVPRYAKPAPLEPPKADSASKRSQPVYAAPAAPTPSKGYAQALPSRAAPGRPDYYRGAPSAPAFERPTGNVCVNCGVVASIGSSGPDWEVRVRFEDGSTETLRYPDRPHLRIGERVHLEDGRLIRE